VYAVTSCLLGLCLFTFKIGVWRMIPFVSFGVFGLKRMAGPLKIGTALWMSIEVFFFFFSTLLFLWASASVFNGASFHDFFVSLSGF